MSESTATPAPQGDVERYRGCRKCNRCVAGTDRQPEVAGDCWADWLDASIAAHVAELQADTRHDDDDLDPFAWHPNRTGTPR